MVVRFINRYLKERQKKRRRVTLNCLKKNLSCKCFVTLPDDLFCRCQFTINNLVFICDKNSEYKKNEKNDIKGRKMTLVEEGEAEEEDMEIWIYRYQGDQVRLPFSSLFY